MALAVTFFMFLFIGLKPLCFSFEIFSGLTAAAGLGAFSASYAAYNYFKCQRFECCDDAWIHFDESKLQQNLHNLFGQHIAKSIIEKSIIGYFRNKNPRKPLVMAFHGLTGSGKNYAAQMIANSTYKKGLKSEFVHIYIGTKDFPHKKEVSRYQDLLREEIPRHTKECGRSLFIFDEIDKMPPGTLDALKPFIDYYDNIDNVDYKKNIFIFLSNSGSNDIMKLILNFWADGQDREDITMKDIEPLVNKGAFNENGGFQFSEILRSELIDVFVPFLPLERDHVKKCIEEEIKSRGIHPEKQIVNKIADELVYFPPELEIFSKSGCKRIQQKVDIFIDL